MKPGARNGNHPSVPRIRRPRQNRQKTRRKLRVIEVRVGVDQHGAKLRESRYQRQYMRMIQDRCH